MIRRTAYSNTHANANGSYTTRIYLKPVNYQTKNGVWHPIDNRLRSSAARGHAWESNHGVWTSLFPRRLGNPVTLRHGTTWVSMALIGASTRNKGTVSGSVVSYSHVAPGVTVRYGVESTGIHETLTLTDPRGPRVFRYEVRASVGMTSRLTRAGVVLSTQCRALWLLKAPRAMQGSSTAEPISYTWEKASKGFVLTEWLPPAMRHSAASPDPQSLNPYTYAYDNPINYVDPLGTTALDVVWNTFNIIVQVVLWEEGGWFWSVALMIGEMMTTFLEWRRQPHHTRAELLSALAEDAISNMPFADAREWNLAWTLAEWSYGYIQMRLET